MNLGFKVAANHDDRDRGLDARGAAPAAFTAVDGQLELRGEITFHPGGTDSRVGLRSFRRLPK